MSQTNVQKCLALKNRQLNYRKTFELKSPNCSTSNFIIWIPGSTPPVLARVQIDIDQISERAKMTFIFENYSKIFSYKLFAFFDE